MSVLINSADDRVTYINSYLMNWINLVCPDGTIITMQTPLLDRYLIKSTATPPNSPPKEHDPITNPLRENPRSPKKTSDPTTLRSPRKPKNAPLVRNSPLGKGKKSQGRPRKDENLDKLEDFVRDADSIQQQFANASLYTPKKKELPLLEGSEESDAVIDVRSHHITPEPEKRAVKRNLRVISGSPLFPTRRTSQRQLELGKKLQEEQQETLKVHNMILKGRDDKRIQVCEFPDKGRGLIASAAFKKNEFVVEYAGDLLTASQAEQREMRYLQAAEKFGCYMYFFCHRGQKWCVDATAETGRYGRLLNHSRYEANLTPEVIEVRQKPYIILRASRDIDIGEELVYDYGERRPAQLAMFPWLKD